VNTKTGFYLRTAAFFALVAIVAISTTLLLYVLWFRPGPTEHPGTSDIYEQLTLSPEEEQRIGAVHQRFQAERSDILREFQQLQGQLAVLLKEEETYSPALADAIHQLHEVHAQLQEISIRRFFAMLETLPPEKQEKLRTLAAETLSQPE